VCFVGLSVAKGGKAAKKEKKKEEKGPPPLTPQQSLYEAMRLISFAYVRVRHFFSVVCRRFVRNVTLDWTDADRVHAGSAVAIGGGRAAAAAVCALDAAAAL
jgi:hypothetical protein